MGSCSGILGNEEFSPPMPRSHSTILSPLGIDFMEDNHWSASPRSVPINGLLKELFGGLIKKLLVQLCSLMFILCWRKNLEQQSISRPRNGVCISIGEIKNMRWCKKGVFGVGNHTSDLS